MIAIFFSALPAVAPAQSHDDTSQSFAQDSFQVGHNLTATSDILENKRCSFGLQVFACRVGARTAIGTSPWMLSDYKMYSLAIRHLISEDADGNRWAVQGTYFQTQVTTNLPMWDQHYDMTAIWLQGIRTYRIRNDYRLHLNADVNYYFRERMPFSLRRPGFTKSPWQINLSSLHQVALSHGWFILGELGALDIFRKPFHTHAGSSIGWESSWFSFHLGFSFTSSLEALFNPDRVDAQQQLRAFSSEGFDTTPDKFLDYSTTNDYAIHPEFALQATF